MTEDCFGEKVLTGPTAGSAVTESHEIEILPDDTIVFVRSAFLFGDICLRVGRVVGFNITHEDGCLGTTTKVEYFVKFNNGEFHWIPSYDLNGHLFVVK